MAIETLNDIVEDVANRLGIYGTCVARDEHGDQVRECLPSEVCRICFVSDLNERIRNAVEIERRLSLAPQSPTSGEQK